jgi:outer membrane immunogenic protein
MKKFVLAAALAACVTAPAGASDFPVRGIRSPGIAMPVIYNWTGFYLGVHAGGTWGDKDWSVVETVGLPLAAGPLGGHNLGAWAVGATVGMNWQVGQFVFGGEGTWSFASGKGDFSCNAAPLATCHTELNWLATIAARVGWAWDRLLLYVKGGVAFAEDDYSMVVTGIGSASSGHTRNGWLVGTGIEYGFDHHFSGKIEYNYMDLGDKDVILSAGRTNARVNIEQQLHLVKVGLNYRFGGGAVVTRY